MDLSASPDVNAFYCYLIVLVLGAITGVRQVSKRLQGLAGVWLVKRTWLLFAGYMFVPVVLFFVLDRAGAIRDTSLFAAVIVGFGYERILAGTSETLQAPGEVSKLWSPFLAYADEIAAIVRSRVERAEFLSVEALVRHLLEDPDRCDRLEKLALTHSDEPLELLGRLQAIRARSTVLAADVVRDQRVRCLFEEIAGFDGYRALLKDGGAISSAFYFLQLRQWAARIRKLLVAFVVLGLLLFAGWWVQQNYVRDPQLSWYLWRLEKQDSSHRDLFRAERAVSGFLVGDSRAGALDGLLLLLRKPDLPARRVDLILQILLEQRCNSSPSDRQLPVLLARTLRSWNIDTRGRIHQALIFMSEERGVTVEDSLENWVPAEGDSESELEERINAWLKHWKIHGTKPLPNCSL